MLGVSSSSNSIDLCEIRNLYSNVFDELHTHINSATIVDDFSRVEDEKERERLKRCWLGMIDYLRLRYGSADLSLSERMDTLSAFVESFSVSKYRPRIPELSSEQSLRTVVDNIISGKQFDVLGPELQKVGEVNGDHRFVCIFCHEVKKKTGDLRVHLIKKHMCNLDDVKYIFHRSNPQGLRVFGQYSYADVCTNRWDIKDWRQRKQRSEVGSEAKRRNEVVLKPTTKPPKSPRISSANDDLPLVQQTLTQERGSQSIGLTQDTTTRSPTSPSTQVSPDGYFAAMPNIAHILDPEMLEEPSSMDSSTADLLQHYGTQFPTNSTKEQEIMFTDGPAVPAIKPTSALYTGTLDSLESTIDPHLLTASMPIVDSRHCEPVSVCDLWLFGPLQQAHHNHRT